nr:MAG TPA: hypothetical protein [Caudoviricetes sp.]
MQTIKMDFQSQSTPPVVPVMQSDAQSRFIGLTLYDGGVPYSAPSGAVYTVEYHGQGANNTGWYDTIQLPSGTRKAVVVSSSSPNVVTLELAEQALRVNGKVEVSLCVVNNTGYKLNTFPIICRVTGAPYVDPVSVRSYFYVTGLTSEQWTAYVTACQDAQKRAEDAAAKFVTDPTLSVEGKAADAKAVGQLKKKSSYIPDVTFYRKSFVNNEGVVENNDNTRLSKPIKLLKGQTIAVTTYGYLRLVSIISTCEQYGTNIKVAALSLDSDKHEYVYKAEKDTYVLISYFIGTNGDSCTYRIYFDGDLYKDETENLKLLEITWTKGAFVNQRTRLLESHSACQYSAPIKLKAGKKIVFHGMGYMDFFAMIALCDSNGNNYYPAVASNNENDISKNYEYTAPFDTYVALSSYFICEKTNIEINCYAYIVENNQKRYYFDRALIGCFNNIVCIGDSLTEGAQGPDFDSYITPWNYPYFLSKLTNWTCENKGMSGVSTTVWWKNHQHDDFSQFDTAIVFLGTNNGLTDTIDDGATVDTDTGNYLKILNKLRADNPKMKIFIITPWNRDAWYFDTTIVVLQKIAKRYGAKLIDGMSCLTGNIYDTSYRKIGDAHMNSIGYMHFANYIYNEVLSFAQDNPTEYNVVYPSYHN